MFHPVLLFSPVLQELEAGVEWEAVEVEVEAWDQLLRSGLLLLPIRLDRIRSIPLLPE